MPDNPFPQAEGARAAVLEALQVRDRAIAAAGTSVVITGPHLPDNPIIYHNPAFERLSGYDAHEIDGYNCRFLQGEATDRAAVAELRRAIVEERDARVTLLNYRKDGTPFWNELFLSPVRDGSGCLTHFVGVQNDVSARKQAEAQRDVLLARQERIVDTLQGALLLLPPADALPGVQISTHYHAAWDEANVGGDFFDAFALEENKVALVVGDVTGKGLQAASHIAEIKFALRAFLREMPRAGRGLIRLNNFLLDAQRLDRRNHDSFVALALAVWDTRTNEAAVAAAAMEPPLVLRAAHGEAHMIPAGGLVLGADARAEYEEIHVRLETGDVLLMATDGITEARAPRTGGQSARAFFGYDGMVAAAQQAFVRGYALAEMGATVAAAAKHFASGTFQDDVCLLLARRRP